MCITTDFSKDIDYKSICFSAVTLIFIGTVKTATYNVNDKLTGSSFSGFGSASTPGGASSFTPEKDYIIFMVTLKTQVIFMTMSILQGCDWQLAKKRQMSLLIVILTTSASHLFMYYHW